MGLGIFVDINIFVMKYFFYLVSSYSPVFSNLLNQNLQNVKTPKSKLGSFVQRYPFKFPALTSNVSVHIMVRGLCTQLTIHTGFLTKDEALETTPSNFYGIYSYSYC